MRGCLLVVAGFLLGAVLFLPWWPALPSDGTPAPAQSDIHVTLSDRYLARLIEERAAVHGVVNLSQLTVTSVPPQTLVAQAQVGIGGLSTPLTLEAQPVVQNGTIAVRVVQTRVGPIPVPPQISTLLAQNLNDSLRSLIGKNTRVTSVRVTGAGVEIYADSR